MRFDRMRLASAYADGVVVHRCEGSLCRGQVRDVPLRLCEPANARWQDDQGPGFRVDDPFQARHWRLKRRCQEWPA